MNPPPSSPRLPRKPPWDQHLLQQRSTQKPTSIPMSYLRFVPSNSQKRRRKEIKRQRRRQQRDFKTERRERRLPSKQLTKLAPRKRNKQLEKSEWFP
ncbi:unnamed protein product [Microthlaspi erraticum]|uniref:Uncharacterized protein n=1 Tax=Microthlaspi erraticum TaxID=1685480 RepID=A0A6D2JL59_9BRAS|nr:unnamed protein product [Microthlaspi erraticum]